LNFYECGFALGGRRRSAQRAPSLLLIIIAVVRITLMATSPASKEQHYELMSESL
jgi:hypothetical protein